MEVLNLERPVEMLLALLRVALHRCEMEGACFKHSTAEDWLQCYRLAVRQGVSALAWSAVECLPVDCRPPLDVKLSWALLEEKQLEKYRVHCEVLNELVGVYARHGIATVVMKGVGLSRLYPCPSHREGGDVDIYTYSADRGRMTDEEANRLANELMERRGIEVDYSYMKVHTSFFFRGVRFENHRRFLNVDTFAEIADVEVWLRGCLLPQTVSLQGGACNVSVPSVEFDSVYVALHAAQHYGCGLSLRHLCDWAVLARLPEFALSRLPENKYLFRVTNALSLLCNRYLGASIPVEEGGGLPDEMMKEIIYPPFCTVAPVSASLRAAWRKVRYKLHLLGLRHRLLGVSLCRGAMKLVLSVLSNPRRLYR